MIEISNLTVDFEDVCALEDISLQIKQGEFVTIIGPSGCGKTTLLRVIGGLQEPTNGWVELHGRSPAEVQATADCGYVFQEHTLFPWKTALENVVFLRELAGKPPGRGRARQLLAEMGLADFAEAYPSELSGGMKQRVAIARGIHLGAELLLMDEPFGELDELTREEVGIELRTTWREQHSETVIFVTHSVPEAVLLGDRCLVMDGPPGQISADIAIELPAPRDRSLLNSDVFQDHLTRLRSYLFSDR